MQALLVLGNSWKGAEMIARSIPLFLVCAACLTCGCAGTQKLFDYYEGHRNPGISVPTEFISDVALVVPGIPLAVVASPVSLPIAYLTRRRDVPPEGSRLWINDGFWPPATCTLLGTGIIVGTVLWPFFGWWGPNGELSDAHESRPQKPSS